MKQVKRIFALMLALALTASMITTMPASAETVALTPADFVNVPVTKTDLISSTTGTAVTQSAAGHFIDDEEGSHSYYWQFTLEDSALISISTCANLFTYNFIGDSTLWLGTDTQCSSKLITVWADGTTEFYTNALEAGTYYLRQDISKDGKALSGDDLSATPIINLSVTAQYLSRTEKATGISKETAIPLLNGITSKGLISGVTLDGVVPQNSITKQIFRIDVNGPTTLNYTAAFSRHTDLTFGFDKAVIVTDHIGAELDNQKSSSYYNETSITSSVKLPAKGAYYITVTSGRFMAIDLTATWEDVVVKPAIKLTVNKIKKNAKKVSGTSVAGASIKVKVGKKTYKGKASASGKFSVKTMKIKKGTKVKVTASLDGYKTKSKTVKAK